MLKHLTGLYRFLPVQLLLLHFRKYQLLLLFWVMMVSTVNGNFAHHFGASRLFLAPEYLGAINFLSMFLLGSAMAIFIMSWNITTFIIHSHRIPFLGATRQAFLKYCINNSVIPLLFLIFYSTVSIRFQYFNEHADGLTILLLHLGFYLGVIVFLLLSFAYFFRVDRDLFKVVLSKITNPSLIREIIPYDSLDVEFDIIRADTYLSETLKVEKFSELEAYHPRLLTTVLRRHHRNAITATIFALALLLVLGAFMENPHMRIPAGSGFLLLFSIMMGVVGAVKYFLKTWELMGWVLIAVFLSFLVKWNIFDLRSIAYGIDYNTGKTEQPEYNYEHLKKLFTAERYEGDKKLSEQRLDKWKAIRADSANSKLSLVILTVSGGGSRSAYWTFRTLQYLDSISKGKLFSNTVLLTGASGGMIGAAYWRSVHSEAMEGRIAQPYNNKYQENIGKDLLNAIIFSFACVDLISPFNKISIAGYAYTKDRGYAMEQELIRNTEGLLDKKLSDFQELEASGKIPQMVFNSTIINDGRRLLVSSQPVSYLTQPVYSLRDTFKPPIDAVDFTALFAKQNPYNLRLTTALRMNATFPYILPVVKLPSRPQMNIMDAGLRDNFGLEVAARYLFVHKEWIEQNVSNVIVLQIRDTREHEVFPPTEQSSIGAMLMDPLTIIEQKWEPFQSYTQGYIRELVPSVVKKVHFVTMTYIPHEETKNAALNFHLTQKEKQDLYNSIYHPQNQAAANSFLQLLQQ
ncbi:MAG TPA: patatin-like phospholipase family protein [Flavipsychrobacter sp.]|nr:patatin-like phospholipase family protein [Flavipsychrobacter sp.]